MPFLSISGLSSLTGKTRETVGKALDGLKSTPGPKGAKLFESKAALEKLYGAAEGNGGAFVTAAEAQRLLTITRTEEIKLNMEILRRERIPIADVAETNEEAFSHVAGVLKAHTGKMLTQGLVNDIFRQFREIGARVRDAGL
jgi:hypothetical protein